MLVAVVHRACNQQHVGMLGVARVDHPETFYVIHGRQTGQHLDVAAVAGTAVKMNYPRRLQAAPLDHIVDETHIPASLRHVQP